MKESQTFAFPDVDMTSRTYKVDQIKFTDVQECEESCHRNLYQLPDGTDVQKLQGTRAVSHIQGKIFIMIDFTLKYILYQSWGI